MRQIESYVASASGRLDRHRGIIDAAFKSAAKVAQELLHAEGIDVLFIDSPEETIPELGVGGYTYSPHVIILAIDPGFPALSEQYLFSSLAHEFHHAMRWRRTKLSGDLGEMLVSEGLAQIFEEEVSGVRPIYSKVPVTALEMGMAKLELHLPAFDQARWFFGSKDITKWFGYAFGYHICATYAKSAQGSASGLVGIPAREVLEVAGL